MSTPVAEYGTYATINVYGVHDRVLVRVGSVDQDITILHLLGPVYGDLKIPCPHGQLAQHWNYIPLATTGEK